MAMGDVTANKDGAGAGWVQYVPRRHKGRTLYMVVSREEGDAIEAVAVKADVVGGEAVMTPWYYMVWDGPGEPEGVMSRKEAGLEEGGPGSGHHGHAGIPHYHGGSRPSGALMFLPQYGKSVYDPETGRYGEPSKHIKAYAAGESKKWTEGLSESEYNVAKAYTTGQGYDWNQCLRRNEGCNEARYDRIAKLKQVIDKSEASQDMVVYRGCSGTDQFSNMKQGQTFSDDGFASTSANPWIADYFGEPILEIEVPAGTKGAWLQGITNYKEEAEFLLQRGTRFVVVGHRTITIPSGSGQEAREVKVTRVQAVQ